MYVIYTYKRKEISGGGGGFGHDFCKDDIIFTRTCNVRVSIICEKLLSDLFVYFEVNMVKLLNLNQFFQ